ncbi:hypothetical protein C8R44DRAFT_726521 [Mycena epipterygia]|nr:hypothetical protein C8R44DRAFT_726521 [Mycena epipterygia]
MCDTLQTPGPILAETQSLVSGTTFGYYICLAFACASPAIYAAHHQVPSKKLARLEDEIQVAEGILKGAKEDCAPRHHADLLDIEGRLLQAKLSASEIQSQMLEAGGVTLLESNAVLDRSLSARIAACYGSLKKYLQNTRGMMKSISKCRKEVEKIRTSTLRIIQEERRHKLVKAIKEVRDVTEVLRSPTHHVHTVRHRGQSSAGGLFQEPYILLYYSIRTTVFHERSLYLMDGRHKWLDSACCTDQRNEAEYSEDHEGGSCVEDQPQERKIQKQSCGVADAAGRSTGDEAEVQSRERSEDERFASSKELEPRPSDAWLLLFIRVVNVSPSSVRKSAQKVSSSSSESACGEFRPGSGILEVFGAKGGGGTKGAVVQNRQDKTAKGAGM